MTKHAFVFRNALLTISLAIGLIACGGGGESGESTNDSWTEVAPSSTKPGDFINARTSVSLNTGNTVNLTLQDQTSLLKWALSTAEQQHYWQKNLLGSLYSNANHKIIQASLQFTAHPSLNLYPTDLSTGIPFAMGDSVCDGSFAIQSGKGCGLGVVTKIGEGRALAYGQEMFSSILNNNANFTQFTEVMNNSLRWLITGDAHQAVNKTLNVVVKGTSNVDVKNYLEKQLATTVNYPACNVLNPENICWKDIDLIVLVGWFECGN